jgi:hypothetical protein
MNEPELTWASHPNADLRMRLAEYLGSGWTIDKLERGMAVISRRKSVSPTWALIAPLVTLVQYMDRRRDRVRLTVEPTGVITTVRLNSGSLD